MTVCKNCGHRIVRDGIFKTGWLHYNGRYPSDDRGCCFATVNKTSGQTCYCSWPEKEGENE